MWSGGRAGGGRWRRHTFSANMPRRSASEHHTRRVSLATACCFSGDSAYLQARWGGLGGMWRVWLGGWEGRRARVQAGRAVWPGCSELMQMQKAGKRVEKIVLGCRRGARERPQRCCRGQLDALAYTARRKHGAAHAPRRMLLSSARADARAGRFASSRHRGCSTARSLPTPRLWPTPRRSTAAATHTVRMLCRRSASLMAITSGSPTMVSIMSLQVRVVCGVVCGIVCGVGWVGGQGTAVPATRRTGHPTPLQSIGLARRQQIAPQQGGACLARGNPQRSARILLAARHALTRAAVEWLAWHRAVWRSTEQSAG